MEHPPYYAGRPLAVIDSDAAIGLLPITYQRGASQPDVFGPEWTPELSELLDEMSRYLVDSDVGLPLSTPEDGIGASGYEPPDVRFGCPTMSGDPDDDCEERDEDVALGRGSQPLHLSVTRPSVGWVTWADSLAGARRTDLTLVVTLEVGQYWIRQRGFRGTKEVELGTDHVARLPWLTALEGPVAVLQLTGALVDRDGKVARIGAEGLMARRTPMKVSALGAQALITEEDVRELRTLRRRDLAGGPLVWHVALRSLVEHLTGRPVGTTVTTPSF